MEVMRRAGRGRITVRKPRKWNENSRILRKGSPITLGPGQIGEALKHIIQRALGRCDDNSGRKEFGDGPVSPNWALRVTARVSFGAPHVRGELIALIFTHVPVTWPSSRFWRPG